MPVFAFAFGLVGTAAILLRWCLQAKCRRVNADLERCARGEPSTQTMPTLKADRAPTMPTGLIAGDLRSFRVGGISISRFLVPAFAGTSGSERT